MSDTAPAPRVLCYHKQRTSARTRFLCFGNSVLPGAPLSATALRTEMGSTRPHPVHHLNALEELLQLPKGSLRAEPEFYEELDTPDGPVAILLAEFTALDPPFAAAESIGARFIALTEARNLPPVELGILKKAYEHILG